MTVSTLIELCSGLAHGIAPTPALEEAVVCLAARTWVAPALHATLERSGSLAQLSPDAQAYLALLRNRSRIRAHAQLAQLKHALNILGESRIVPLLVKGAAGLVVGGVERAGERIMCDLDLVVPAEQHEKALGSLISAGYQHFARGHSLSLQGMPGLLEIHAEIAGDPPRPQLLRAMRRSAPEDWAALLPDANAWAYDLVVHDMIKDGDWWRGTIDLRHLVDLHALNQREGIDWATVRALMPNDVGKAAVEAQALLLERLMGTGAPPSNCSVRAQIAARRMVSQAREGATGHFLKLAGVVSWSSERIRRGAIPGPWHYSFWSRSIRMAARGRTATARSASGIFAGPKA